MSAPLASPSATGSGRTMGDIVATVRQLLGSDNSLSVEETAALAQTRFELIYETWNWSRRLRDFTIQTVAQITSDSSNLVWLQDGSSHITSVGTPFTDSMIGRQIQLSTGLQYYFIQALVSPSELILGDGEGNEVPYHAPAAPIVTSIFNGDF